MGFYFPNVDYTYIFKRKGTPEDPFLDLIDTANVSNGAIVLREVPSFKNEVIVKDSNGNTLIQSENETLGDNEYRVDYSVGIVYFNSLRNGQQMTIEYLGMGWVFISAARVMMMGQEGDPLESLQEMLEYAQEGVDTLEQVGSLDFKGEYSDTYAYRKWNFVTYNNKTYVAIKDGLGFPPTNNEYWSLVSSGVGVAGIYDKTKIYSIGDIVSDEENRNLYVSLVDNNSYGLENKEYWQLVISLDGVVDNLNTLINKKIDDLNALEEQMKNSDTQRDLNDEERDGLVANALATMQLFREDIESEENDRILNENNRKSEEILRKSSENTRISNESQRQLQETTRQNQEQMREQNTTSAIKEISNVLNELENLEQGIDMTLDELSQVKNDTEIVKSNTEGKLSELSNFAYIGEYNPELFYKKNNIVSYNGSSYIALQDIIETDEELEIDITDENYWGKLALAGRDITELNIDGISPNEDGFLSLEPLGLARENQLIELQGNIEGDYNLKIGDLSMLRTTRKDSIVEAINELKTRIDDLIDVIA